MNFTINTIVLLDIIHLCCYILALVPSVFLSLSIDYTKILKKRSNGIYYICAIAIGIVFTYLIGEFLYQLLTMFVY